jgi:autotransporter translocation and assembly factor TamB
MAKKRQKYYFLAYFLILLIGSTGIFLTKTDAGFTIVYKILKRQIDKQYNITLSIEDIFTPLRSNLEADMLEFANADSSIMIKANKVNVSYKGIFELFGRQRLENLVLLEPEIFIRSSNIKKEPNELIKAISFPNVYVNDIKIENAKIHFQSKDTLIYQEVEKLQFHYSGKGDIARILIKELNIKNEDLGIEIKDLSSELVIKNNIAKLRDLKFLLNDSPISSAGKIRFIEPLRFQFAANVQDIPIHNYIELPFIQDNDKINMKLDVIGNFTSFTALVNLEGVLNDQVIEHSVLNLEYKDDYVHLLQGTIQNSNLDISLNGIYGIKDKYISTSISSQQLKASDWISGLPDFDLQGHVRAQGYFNEEFKVNYDLNCIDLYGMPITTLQGNVLMQGLNEIVLDTTNYIYLSDGTLRLRGSIYDLETLDIEVLGDINSLGKIEIPGVKDVAANDIILTLKVLGKIVDPDIQMNLNLDSLRYDVFKMKKLNLSLFSKKTISEPGGALLVSFQDAFVDSIELGSVQTYLMMKDDFIKLDYFDISHENYNFRLSGTIEDLKEFKINKMQGVYRGEDVYLLEPVQFNILKDGYALSRYDLLYRDALLSGSLNIKNDLLEGNLNVAGAELNSLPLVSTMLDSIEGLLDMNIDLNGSLNNPKLDLSINLKRAHAFGLAAKRIRSKMSYENKKILIKDLKLDIDDERYMAMNGYLPLSIDFKTKNIVELLPQEQIYAELDLHKIRLSKLLPFILPLHIVGDANAKGTITGTINDPTMHAKLNIFDAEIEKILADSIDTDFHYSNERLFFNDIHAYANNGSYKGNANFYLDLRFQPEGERFQPDSSVYVYVQGQDDELLYLTPFIDPVEDLTGEFYTEMVMRGSFNKTVKDGKVIVKNGILVLDILGNEIKNIDGQAIMKNNIAKVDLKGLLPPNNYSLAEVIGMKAAKYNFTIDGNLDMRYLISPKFDLKLKGDQLSINTLDDKIDLTTGMVELDITGRDTLAVAGDVTIQEGSIEYGFTNRVTPQSNAPTQQRGGLKTAYSIDAIIDKAYFRNQFVDATLNGEMILQKFPNEDRTRMGGELFVSDGFFNYWASVFVLEEGSLVLDQFENNHQMNFIAKKYITDGNEIIATISGELNNPEISFTDKDNEMSQAQIVQTLTVGEIQSVLDEVGFSQGTGTGTGLNIDFTSAANALLTLAEVPLEQQARQFASLGGLDRIDIKGGDGTYIDETTALVIGGRIGQNFYLTYEASQEEPLKMEFEYRLNNKISIVGAADDKKVEGAVRLRLQY